MKCSIKIIFLQTVAAANTSKLEFAGGFFFFFFFLGGGGVGLRPFQEYFTYIEPIVHRRWAKTREPGEKPPDHP